MEGAAPTTPPLRKGAAPPPLPPLHEDANTAVIAVVIALVFLTLLAALAVIAVYLYKNQGSYLTYEQPAGGPDAAVPTEDTAGREKEEYFI